MTTDHEMDIMEPFLYEFPFSREFCDEFGDVWDEEANCWADKIIPGPCDVPPPPSEIWKEHRDIDEPPDIFSSMSEHEMFFLGLGGWDG